MYFLLLNSFLSSVDLLASTVGWLLCLFFSESPAIGYVQHSWLRKIYTLQRASRVVLPVLRHKQMSSRCRHVMHISNRDFKLTFISVTNTYIRTYAHPKNRSLIQSFALRRSTISRLIDQYHSHANVYPWVVYLITNHDPLKQTMPWTHYLYVPLM